MNSKLGTAKIEEVRKLINITKEPEIIDFLKEYGYYDFEFCTYKEMEQEKEIQSAREFYKKRLENFDDRFYSLYNIKKDFENREPFPVEPFFMNLQTLKYLIFFTYVCFVNYPISTATEADKEWCSTINNKTSDIRKVYYLFEKIVSKRKMIINYEDHLWETQKTLENIGFANITQEFIDKDKNEYYKIFLSQYIDKKYLEPYLEKEYIELLME